MQTQVIATNPVFELKGVAGRIDLSAWISGLSFGSGLWLAASPNLAAQLIGAGPGLYVILAAFGAFLAAVLVIQRHMRLSVTASSFGSPQRLTTNGIFRCSRNPIYVAFFVPLAAISYFSLSAAIAAIAIYIFAMNLTVISKEERELASVFGADYTAYKAVTPRWMV